MDSRITLALKIMESELGRPLSVKLISTRLGLSESRFGHLFKSQTGRPFKASLRDDRLEKAKDLLFDPTLRVKEIASSIGYTYLSNFTRDFTKHFGKPPSQYRGPYA